MHECPEGHEVYSHFDEKTSTFSARYRPITNNAARNAIPPEYAMRNSCPLRPHGDRLVLTMPAKTDVTEGGIHLPDSTQTSLTEGTVLAVGPGRTTDEGRVIPMPFKVGDVVIYGKYGGSAVKVNGEEYFILSADQVLATKTA